MAIERAALRRIPPLLQETFTPNDPVHGLMHLPAIVKVIVDTMTFQRMRHIKQLGTCHFVYPGATHTRFFHSIGTSFLAHELVKSLRQRQPELGITDRDALCVTLAALCHDLGHPMFSHMFEVFIHSLGRDRRRVAEARAKEQGFLACSAAEDEEVRRYETWSHERASVMLLEELFEELRKPLHAAGLRNDAEGNDFACICELIDPPKKELEKLLETHRLKEGWSSLIKGRPVEKAWLYEVVSNWRSGIDVDKFDYFRRDALFLGIQRQFDHSRYMRGVKVLRDEYGIPTLSPPDKDKDMLRENMLELRKSLHRAAYHHKTVKKIELHMVDILKMTDEHVRVTGRGGAKMSMSEAAVTFDPIAYRKLTDTFIEARLLEREDPRLEVAAAEYESRIVRRNLMRLIGDWDLPRLGEEGMPGPRRPFPMPTPEAVAAGVLECYRQCAKSHEPDQPVQEVFEADLRCQAANFHYGMGARDPITRVVFHSTKSEARKGFKVDIDARPLRQKLFVFWNPSPEKRTDELTLRRLTLAFNQWAELQIKAHSAFTDSPRKVISSPVRKPPSSSLGPPRRTLRIQSSCPLDM